MHKNKKKNIIVDVSGSYTGKYLSADGKTLDAKPEQDVDDL